jgi:uncharacterized membrane protein (DUF106 family)
MFKKISKSKEIIDKLQSEGKVTDLSNDPEFLKKVEEMNKYMEEVHRDYLFKSRPVDDKALYTSINI